jgi:hypothetical protein
MGELRGKSARGRLGFRCRGPVKGWERSGVGGVLLVRKFTSSGVERTVRLWRWARWDFAVTLWRAG